VAGWVQIVELKAYLSVDWSSKRRAQVLTLLCKWLMPVRTTLIVACDEIAAEYDGGRKCSTSIPLDASTDLKALGSKVGVVGHQGAA